MDRQKRPSKPKNCHTLIAGIVARIGRRATLITVRVADQIHAVSVDVPKSRRAVACFHMTASDEQVVS